VVGEAVVVEVAVVVVVSVELEEAVVVVVSAVLEIPVVVESVPEVSGEVARAFGELEKTACPTRGPPRSPAHTSLLFPAQNIDVSTNVG